MKVQWKNLLTKTATWLAAEVFLNLLGLDNLADYSEFVFERHDIVEFPTAEQAPSPSFPSLSLDSCNLTPGVNNQSLCLVS